MKAKLIPHNGPTMSISDGSGMLNVGGRLVKWSVGDDEGFEADWQKMLAEDRVRKQREVKAAKHRGNGGK